MPSSLRVLTLALSLSPLMAQESNTFSFRVTGRGDLANVSLVFKDMDLVLVSDKGGHFLSPLDDNRERFPFTNGVYAVEFLRQNVKARKTLVLGPGSPNPVVFDLGELKGGETQTRTLEQVQVIGDNRSDSLSRSVITAAEARSIPGGGGDILRSLVNLPGVTTSAFLGSDLYIRGGDRFDLLYTYDGVRIGNPFHNLGFYSVFPSASLDSVNFYPGAFPIRFGNSQGAVIEVLSKSSYDRSQVHGEIDANLAVAGGFLTIPLGNSVQLSFGGRRTYYEAYLALIKSLTILPDSVRSVLTAFDTIPFFSDLNGKIDWQINGQNNLTLFGISSRDTVSLNAERISTNGSNSFSLNLASDSLWDTEGIIHRFKGRSLQNTATAYRYFSSNSVSFQGIAFDNSYLQNIGVVDDARLTLSPAFELGFGFEYLYQVNPLTLIELAPRTNAGGGGMGFAALAAFTNLTLKTNTLRPDRHSLAGYVAATWHLGTFDFEPGLRVTGNNLNGNFDLDPRLAITWKAGKIFDLTARLGKYSQLPTVEATATNFGDPNLTSAYAIHYNLGARLAVAPFEIKIDGYYKDLQNQLIANPSYDFYFTADNQNPRYLNTGLGRAYGLEVLLRKQMGHGLFAWLSYALSRSERFNYIQNTQVTAGTNLTLNNGLDYKTLSREWQPFNEDVTHTLTFIGSWEVVPKALKLSTRFALATGKPFTDRLLTYNPVTSNFGTAESANKLTERYPLQFTWDFRIDYTVKLFHKLDLSFYLDLWNVQTLFNYQNVAGYQFSTENATLDKVGQGAVRKPVNGLPLVPLLGISLAL